MKLLKILRFIICRSNKFCADSERESIRTPAEIVQTTVAPPQFARTSENFTRPSTRTSSVASEQFARIIPVELKTFNGLNQFFSYF